MPRTSTKRRQNGSAVEGTLDAATPDDIPTLVRHRREVFEEMDTVHGLLLEEEQMAGMDRAYGDFLRRTLEDGTTAAWVVREGHDVVCSGGVTFIAWPPAPRDTSGRVGLVHSVYTLPGRRRHGYAHAVMQAAIEYCHKYGVHRVKINATDAGRSLYEALGFRPAESEMQLLLD